MRSRLVPEGFVPRVALVWAALGLVVGAAVGALVRLETRPVVRARTVYHGRYVPGGAMSRAYESTLRITFDGQHQHDLAVVTGVAIGLLAGLLVGVLRGLRTSGPMRRIRPVWPSGRARR